MANWLAAPGGSRPEHAVSDTATVRALAPTRTGDPAAGVRVSDHVGQPAAEAARAVRRAGLRPGLDRSFGCEPQLTGLVVAQEPASGEQIARNAMVTLYIAAPGAQVEQKVRRGDPERSSTDDTVQHSPAAPEMPGADQRRTRRKRSRDPGREDRTFPPAPEPSVGPSHGASWEAATHAETQADQSEDPQSAVRSAEETVKAPELQEHEPSYETLLAEGVFAARSGEMAARARIHPHIVRASAWQRALKGAQRRPGFATYACAVLAVWLAVALAGALRGGRPEGGGAGTPAQKTAGPETTIAARRDPAAIRRRAPTALRPGTDTARPRGKATPEQARRPGARAAAASTAAQAQAAPVPTADAPPARAPAVQQSGGGPFSP